MMYNKNQGMVIIVNGGEIIRTLIKEAGMTQERLASAMGYKSQSAVAERLKKDMRVSVFSKMCEMLGYEIYIVPKARGGSVSFKKENAIKLTAPEGAKKDD